MFCLSVAVRNIWRRVQCSPQVNIAIASCSSIGNSSISVQNVEGRTHIRFDYRAPGCPLRTYTMSRSDDEEIGITLSRLADRIAKIRFRHLEKEGKVQTKRNVLDAGITVTQHNPNLSVAGLVQRISQTLDFQIPNIDLFKDGNQLDSKIKNNEAWSVADEMRLGDTSFCIKVIKPTIKSIISLPKCILVGYPIYPKIDVEFEALQDSEIDWYREVKTLKPEIEKEMCTKEHFNCSYIYLCSTLLYVPTLKDIGFKLRAVYKPVLEASKACDKTLETVSEVKVCPNEGVSAVEERFKYTHNRCVKSCFRVVTYNLLADLFSRPENSSDKLNNYSYCDAKFLNMEYRKLLLLKELTGYNADLLCLQDVNKHFFDVELTMALSLLGYKGDFVRRGTRGSIGEALFYRQDKFRLIKDYSISISAKLFEDKQHTDILKHFDKLPEAVECHDDMDEETKYSIEFRRLEMDELKLKLLHGVSILQAVVLECIDNNKYVIAATTRLASNALADNIRLIQTEVCIQHIQALREKYTVNGEAAAVVFAGDMNSSPWSGIYEYMTTGTIPANHRAWYSSGISQYMPIQLQHNMSLLSACGTPEYTKFSTSLRGCVDYIFVSKDCFDVKQVVPLPSHKDILKNTALPSKHFPSDHLALVCDVAWKPKDDAA